MSWRELKWQCSGLEVEALGPSERRAEARLVQADRHSQSRREAAPQPPQRQNS